MEGIDSGVRPKFYSSSNRPSFISIIEDRDVRPFYARGIINATGNEEILHSVSPGKISKVSTEEDIIQLICFENQDPRHRGLQ